MRTKETIKLLTSAPVSESLGILPEVSSFEDKSSVEVSLEKDVHMAPTSAKLNTNKLNTCTRVNAYSVNRQRRNQMAGA